MLSQLHAPYQLRHRSHSCSEASPYPTTVNSPTTLHTLSDEEMIGELEDAAEALREGLS